MIRTHYKPFFCIVWLASCLLCCHKEATETSISESKMGYILAQLHLIAAVEKDANPKDSLATKFELERKALYESQGLNQKTFQEALNSYVKKPSSLTKVYQKATDTLDRLLVEITQEIAQKDQKAWKSIADSLQASGRNIRFRPHFYPADHPIFNCFSPDADLVSPIQHQAIPKKKPIKKDAK